MKNLSIYLFVASLLFSSCRTYTSVYTKTHKQAMDEFLEKNPYKADILVAMGPYDSEIDDGKGGKIITYDDSYISTSEGANTTYYTIYGVNKSATNKSSTSYTNERKISFYIDKNNYCYRWHSVGKNFGKIKTTSKIDAGKTILLGVGIIGTIMIFGELLNEDSSLYD